MKPQHICPTWPRRVAISTWAFELSLLDLINDRACLGGNSIYRLTHLCGNSIFIYSYNEGEVSEEESFCHSIELIRSNHKRLDSKYSILQGGHNIRGIRQNKMLEEIWTPGDCYKYEILHHGLSTFGIKHRRWPFDQLHSSELYPHDIVNILDVLSIFLMLYSKSFCGFQLLVTKTTIVKSPFRFHSRVLYVLPCASLRP